MHDEVHALVGAERREDLPRRSKRRPIHVRTFRDALERERELFEPRGSHAVSLPDKAFNA
ncbi:hypothetical protein AKJ09_08240 [Labilithrix luteola]|uniref:Uncharacterized protein n=1 Tax=Labilithrix luteola TaxID=1391654 RepID=A0A0K1Q7D2_9BACT|nr:hypothetical protein AKJ09_08240 [Labilithrix luteola]